MSEKVEQLRALLRDLRDEKTGCAWTRSQDFSSLIGQTIEESYELLDAIQKNDVNEIKSELADMLYHLLFYTQLAEEQKLFSLDDLADAMIQKHDTRMPSHAARQSMDAAETNAHWQAEKAKKRSSILADIAPTLPAMMQAFKLQQRAADVGFDWPETADVTNKIEEELHELREAIANNQSTRQIQSEAGDLLFSCINLIRHCGLDPESSLQACNRKFTSRFQFIEQRVKEANRKIQDMTLAELEQLWLESKQAE